MTPSADRIILDYSTAKLQEQSKRIEDCVKRLTDEQVWARGGENENAVGNLVLHLCGNVRQWIVSGVGARPDIRQRNEEFDARGGVPIPELLEKLRTTISDAASVLQRVTPERMLERVVIQNYDVTVLEAIYHVVEHFSGHTGQIIFATKMLTGSDLGYYAHLRTKAAHGHKMP
jgi:uncharacterized damage-inducible protein DinB